MGFLYRPHRRLLAEAMEKTVELKDGADLILHIKHEFSPFPHRYEISDKTIQVKKYMYDDRIGWDTHLVTLEVEGKAQAIGFTNGPVTNLD